MAEFRILYTQKGHVIVTLYKEKGGSVYSRLRIVTIRQAEAFEMVGANVHLLLD
jgi:hypothetical protein